jgi:hypothetical protein
MRQVMWRNTISVLNAHVQDIRMKIHLIERGERGMAKQSGLYLYNVTFLDNHEKRVMREFIGQNLKQVIMKAEEELQQEFGFQFLLISAELYA